MLLYDYGGWFGTIKLQLPSIRLSLVFFLITITAIITWDDDISQLSLIEATVLHNRAAPPTVGQKSR